MSSREDLPLWPWIRAGAEAQFVNPFDELHPDDQEAGYVVAELVLEAALGLELPGADGRRLRLVETVSGYSEAVEWEGDLYRDPVWPVEGPGA